MNNTRGKPPAFQFYPTDFLTGTTFMTAEAVGGFIRLLCHQWETGGIPDDDEVITQVTGCRGNAVASIRQKFFKDSDGLLKNRRLEAIRAEQEEYRAKQADKANLRWGKREKTPKQKTTGNAVASASAMPVDMPQGMPEACPPPPPPIVPPISPTGDAPDDAEVVSAIWDGHPQQGRTRSSRAKVTNAWKAVPKAERPTLENISRSLALWRASEDWRKEGGQFVPGAHRWVNDRRWEDDPIPAERQSTPAKQRGYLVPGDEGFVSCHDIGRI